MKKLLLKSLVMIALLAFFQHETNAANWFVKGDGTTNTTGGSTWATAVTLAKAASSAATGDIIYLAAGTYTQTASTSLTKAYTVAGGFTGTEDENSIDLSMSNPAVNITKFTQGAPSTFRIFAMGSSTLTGTITLQGITFDGLNNNQNGMAVECSSSSTLTTVIKNCTFKNFAASATNTAGAVNINNTTANVSLQNCWFENITSGNNGGAVSTNTKTAYTINISGCTFKTTTAPSVATNYNGGAIYVNGSATNAYTLNIDSCTFNGTKAGTGGAIYTAAYVTVNLTNSNFLNCRTANTTAGSGHGGAIIFQAPVFKITNCKFDGCSDNGRGLIYWNAASTRTTIKKSIFINNTSGGTTQNSGAVFGVQNATSFITIDSCFAYNNTSSANTSNMCSSVLYSAAGKSNISIKNSAFVGNIGKSVVTRAIYYATAATTADTLSFENLIVSNNTNLATNDTVRDISQFSKTYSKVNYSNIIANGEYRPSGNVSGNYFNTKYTDMLTSGDISTLTSPTNINDIISAMNALFVKYNRTTSVDDVFGNQNILFFQGHLKLNKNVEKASVFSVLGEKIAEISQSDDFILSEIPDGVYIVNYSIQGKCMSYKFIK
jgi:hypothetical protein